MPTSVFQEKGAFVSASLLAECLSLSPTRNMYRPVSTVVGQPARSRVSCPTLSSVKSERGAPTMVVKMGANSCRPETLDWYGFWPTVTGHTRCY